MPAAVTHGERKLSYLWQQGPNRRGLLLWKLMLKSAYSRESNCFHSNYSLDVRWFPPLCPYRHNPEMSHCNSLPIEEYNWICWRKCKCASHSHNAKVFWVVMWLFWVVGHVKRVNRHILIPKYGSSPSLNASLWVCTNRMFERALFKLWTVREL